MTYRTKQTVTGKCSVKNKTYNLCQAMDKWLGNSCVNEGKGSNYLCEMTVVRGEHSGLRYYKGIVAHSPKTNGIFLNQCPWCGESILNLDAEGILTQKTIGGAS